MEETANSIVGNNRISLSRNTPVALVVGVAGFLGSHLAEELLAKNIQVIGVDNLSTGHKKNLEELVKDKRFHLFHQSISQPLGIKPPRLDYAFFVADAKSEFAKEDLYKRGLSLFLQYCQEFSPKIVFASSIALYNSKVARDFWHLKQAEIHLAKFVKENGLNARVVRLSPLYGPRMHFREDDPVIRLIQASLLEELQSEQTSLDFSSRDLFIEDAVKLILKTALSGATAQKIYDGALTQPLKVSEIKQILLDPLWYEEKGFSPTELPPWLTPNLAKTTKELSWKPHTPLVEGLKKTVKYFKDNQIEIPALGERELEVEAKGWNQERELHPPVKQEKEVEKEISKTKDQRPKTKKVGEYQKKLGVVLILALIFYALIFPLLTLGWGIVSIRSELISSSKDIQEGNFAGALSSVNRAGDSLNQIEGVMSFLAILKRVNILSVQINQLNALVSSADKGVGGARHAVLGTKYLYQSTKIISGEDQSDPKPIYQMADQELQAASEQLSEVGASLDDPSLRSLPLLNSSMNDFKDKISFYSNLVEKGRAASSLLPQLTAIGGKSSYLVLLQNNLELRPGGGFIGSYARLDFEGGRLKNISVDDIYNLDGALKVHVEPPPEIKNDLGQSNYYLRDSNFEPDFPTSAREAEFFYNQEAGQRVNGVIALDLSASSKLLDAVGGLDLTDYSEHVDGSNLFQKAISHAEVGFFPGSQAKKNYLTSLENQLFNKIFFLSQQNWPAIIQALSDSLDEKHLMVYLDDPTLFSYVTAQNWGGVLPRPSDERVGETQDFLAPIDANLGADKANYYLDRSYLLETSFGKEGQIYHSLKITYQNNSPSATFPAGPYKNRFRIYLPLGAKLTKASFGEDDITQSVSSFSDYGRAGYSTLITVAPKETKVLSLDYQLEKPLSFDGNQSLYKLSIFKEAGTLIDPFKWSLTYPINMKASSNNPLFKANNQELDLNTDLLTDKSFEVKVSK